MFTFETILLVGSLLILISILVSKTGYRYGVPALLLFLFVGILFGTDGVGVSFNNMKSAEMVGVVGLSIILFSGGMETKFSEIRPVIGPGVSLATFGVLLTALITGIFIYWISGFDKTSIALPLATSLLLASTMSSTDSASVFNILRSQKMDLKNNLRPMLELESGSNDPMAYMLTIALITYIKSGDSNVGAVLLTFSIQFAVGIGMGYLMGKGLAWLINRINLPNRSLYSILMLCWVFIAYALTYNLKGNGFLAVYIAGMIVGNSKIPHKKDMFNFMGGMTWLFQIVMFLTLGLLVNPHEMLGIAVSATLIGIFVILVARPLSVFISLLPFRKIDFKSKLFVSWVGLRGAAPIIFSMYPVLYEVDGSRQIFNIVFFITLLSLIIQGMTIPIAAKLLKLNTPIPKTGNEFGVELPEEIGTDLEDVIITPQMLVSGNRLMDLDIPKGTLVMLIKRGEEFIVPNGQAELQVGDKMLYISEKSEKISE